MYVSQIPLNRFPIFPFVIPKNSSSVLATKSCMGFSPGNGTNMGFARRDRHHQFIWWMAWLGDCILSISQQVTNVPIFPNVPIFLLPTFAKRRSLFQVLVPVDCLIRATETTDEFYNAPNSVSAPTEAALSSWKQNKRFV